MNHIYMTGFGTEITNTQHARTTRTENLLRKSALASDTKRYLSALSVPPTCPRHPNHATGNSVSPRLPPPEMIQCVIFRHTLNEHTLLQHRLFK